MALRNIVKQGDPILRKKCKPVTAVDDHVRDILDDMTETLRNAEGIGLAGPQVGIMRRIVVIELEGQHLDLINPEIIAKEGDQYEAEACLSVPGLCGMVHRPEKVVVRALDRNGEPVEHIGTGLLARAFCHELDHLDGVLYTDISDDVFNPDEEAEEDK